MILECTRCEAVVSTEYIGGYAGQDEVWGFSITFSPDDAGDILSLRMRPLSIFCTHFKKGYN
jgi:hypothetical protein